MLYGDYVKGMLFDDLIVLDCGCINIESSAEGKEEKKRVWTKRKRRWNESDAESLVFLVHRECTRVMYKKQVSVWIRRG